MSGNNDPEDRAKKPGPGETDSEDYPAVPDAPALSGRLFNSLTLILLGASIGVFWREVFHLTIRAIQALT